MSETVVYLVISLCAIGGPWLTMVIMTKAKRSRTKRSIALDFANHFSPDTPQRPRAAVQKKVSRNKPLPMAIEKRDQENARLVNPRRALLPPGAGPT
jgi:hypothetical protein